MRFAEKWVEITGPKTRPVIFHGIRILETVYMGTLEFYDNLGDEIHPPVAYFGLNPAFSETLTQVASYQEDTSVQLDYKA